MGEPLELIITIFFVSLGILAHSLIVDSLKSLMKLDPIWEFALGMTLAILLAGAGTLRYKFG